MSVVQFDPANPFHHRFFADMVSLKAVGHSRCDAGRLRVTLRPGEVSVVFIDAAIGEWTQSN